MGQIIAESEIAKYVDDWRQRQLSVVLTNGCFDLLHIGHLHTFREAKKLADILVVGINSDQSITDLKGPGRPLVSQDFRAELVAALQPVDFVIIFNEFTADLLLEKFQPQLYLKGGDYTLASLPEEKTILKLGIKTNFVPLISGFSTTELIRRIKKN